MLKDRLNNAKSAIDRAKIIEQQKKDGTFESEQKRERQERTTSRNAERLEAANEFVRISKELNELFALKMKDVEGALVTNQQVQLPVEGLSPEDESPITLGYVNMCQTTVEFIGKKLELVPNCRTQHGGSIRVFWTLDILINGSPQEKIIWEIDYYTNKNTSLDSSLKIKNSFNQDIRHGSVADEVKFLLEKTFLS